MSSEQLNGLYQQLILDHSKSPHGRVTLEHPTASSHQLNPTCGDEITLSIQVDAGTIAHVGWEGHGCTISQSSASLLSSLVEGREVDDTRLLLEEFRTALRSRGAIELDEERFGDAIALNGVSRYVARVKCAMLAWVALEHALADTGDNSSPRGGS
ncbi:Fe-S cluster assembly sulfur transfer protein SufU [Salinibacterium sp.]|uniref:Fe-S cluster assembly sulfur transfer protein SufU n=1 Tax=Salinibacterium sp. TaxID=1915057 RepID=UPI00286B8DDD|nr:SUF system NifU family Fe-S cluster assembly protein [Salinibacterium sp.]